MLLALAPGLRVVRRGHDHLQVGLYDDRRLVLPVTAATAHVLERIGRHEPVDLDLPGVAATAAQLLDAGCVVPQGAARPSPERARARVAVVGRIGVDPVPMLAEAGFETLLTGSDHAYRAEVVLLLSQGEPDRERLDPWLRAGLPHLLVRVVDGAVVLGPFVLPGRSACLRCIDARVAEGDPDHLPVLARYAEASRLPRTDGSDDPEPALVSLALAWAVRDLLVHVEGHTPATCSCTVRLGPGPAREVHSTWTMHPECGCCWPGLSVP